MDKKTIPLGDRFCPKCGKWGEEKKRIRGTIAYIYFDHYGRVKLGAERISKLHHHYLRSCYIGREDRLRARVR